MWRSRKGVMGFNHFRNLKLFTVFHVLQHRNAIFMESCKYADIFLSLKTSALVKLLNFS